MIRLPNPPQERPNEDPRQLGLWRNELYRMFSLGGSATYSGGAIAAGGVNTISVTVTGARADQAQTVEVGAPSAIDAGLMWCGVVTATDTAEIRIYNSTGSPITPASSTWTVRVLP